MLTKTDFKNFLECPAYLWLKEFRPDLLPKETLDEIQRGKMGEEVDNLARRLFPEGVEVKGFFEDGFAAAKALMARGKKVLFQPTAISPRGLLARADIVTWNEKLGAWDIREVKMGTSVDEKEHFHLSDVAFQKICFEEAGIKIGRIYIIHVNNEYVKHGEIEPEKFFITVDATDEVEEKIEDVKFGIEAALNAITSEAAPDLGMLLACEDVKGCKFIRAYCGAYPEAVKLAGRLPAKQLAEFLKYEIFNPKDVAKDVLESIGYKEGKSFTIIDKPILRQELLKLKYPLYFLDYETLGLNEAIPLFDGYKPYQKVPFQYSLHIRESEGGKTRQNEFLARERVDPMPALLEQLKRDIGPDGSVIVWNKGFEMTVNKEMAVMHPAYGKFLRSVNDRVFDLMEIFRFSRKVFIKSEFKQSHSIKKVLPVLCPELAYSSLEI